MMRVKFNTGRIGVWRMAYGTWPLLPAKPSAQEIHRRPHHRLEPGITTIDTAEI